MKFGAVNRLMTVLSIREFNMTMDSLIKKAVAKTGEPIKLKRRNAQPEAIEQAKVIAWARANERNYPFLWMLHFITLYFFKFF